MSFTHTLSTFQRREQLVEMANSAGSLCGSAAELEMPWKESQQTADMARGVARGTDVITQGEQHMLMENLDGGPVCGLWPILSTYA